MLFANPSFRRGLYAGLFVALALGIYLAQLWASEHQVRLHSEHFLGALEAQDWSKVREFLHPSYEDQWGHDRATLMSRLRQVLPAVRHLQIETRQVIVYTSDGLGEWRARVTVEADPGEVATLIKERINPLPEPFELHWRQVSKKPWDWKLIGAGNPALQLSATGY